MRSAAMCKMLQSKGESQNAIIVSNHESYMRQQSKKKNGSEKQSLVRPAASLSFPKQAVSSSCAGGNKAYCSFGGQLLREKIG